MTVMIKLPVKFTVKFNDDDWDQWFKEQKRLTPCVMEASCGHAESLEYGTGPLSLYQPTVDGGAYSFESIEKELTEWCVVKLQMDRMSARGFAHSIAVRFWTVGMRPHIYWRPAVAWVEQNLQEWFDNGHSVYDVLDEGIRIANRLIMEQNLPYTGELQQSLHVREMNDSEAEASLASMTDVNNDDSQISKVWADQTYQSKGSQGWRRNAPSDRKRQ